MENEHSKVLNLVKQGEWKKAHQIVQLYSDQYSCLIHAYLHRVEGDLSNAQYWYKRAGTKMSDNSLDEELNRLNLLIFKNHNKV